MTARSVWTSGSGSPSDRAVTATLSASRPATSMRDDAGRRPGCRAHDSAGPDDVAAAASAGLAAGAGSGQALRRRSLMK